MKIFVTGGSGYLGKVLVNYLQKNHDILAPNSKECNILNTYILSKTIKDFNPDIVIHLAAFVDTFRCEEEIEKALDINVIGTSNIVKTCLNLDCKFIYISSEYVFGGNKGNYTIDDKLDPINVYGKTKTAAEYIVSVLSNYQIIRAPFIRQIYPKVFTDQYCSRYFLDEVVEKIIKNIFNNPNKLIHISSERTSLYDLYVKNGIPAEPITMSEEQRITLPKDTSLIDNSI
jgi:dTDP-4-dehydrorhamnose reductase